MASQKDNPLWKKERNSDIFVDPEADFFMTFLLDQNEFLDAVFRAQTENVKNN